jgi:hypothetical protein
VRKPTDGQLAIGALIAFAFWIFVALPLYYGSRDDAAPQKCSTNEIENHSFWEKARCDPVAYFTIWLVGFTGILAASTIGLWVVTWRGSVRQSRDMRDTLDHARESLTAIERAFIAISDLNVSTICLQGVVADYRLHFNIINSGRTPARGYTASGNLVVLDTIPDDFRFADRPHDKIPKQVIGPQSRTYLQLDLLIQDAIAIFEKKKRALIYGWIEYDDIFPGSPRHRTEFCMEVELFADPREIATVIRGTPLPIVTARPYGRYNGNDQDCLYRPGETPIAREGELPPPTQMPENPPMTPAPIVTYTLG